MKTLTVTRARAKLGYWMKRAAAGEEIGIIVGANLIALRPVPIEAGDYAAQEYGLSAEEAERAAARVHEAGQAMRASGEFVALEEAIHVIAPGRSQKRRQSRRRAS